MSWKVLKGYARCGISNDGQRVRWNTVTEKVEVAYYTSWHPAGSASSESQAMVVATNWLSDKR